MTNNDYVQVYEGGVQEVDERSLQKNSNKSDAIQINSDPTFAELYNGIAKDSFSRKVTDILTAPIDPLTVEIKPDGLIYLPEIKYRQILNEAFGVGAYSFLIRDKKTETVSGKQIRVHVNLIMFIEGRYHAEAWGAADYWQNNPNSDYSTAIESAKSVAIRRCCKDLGVGTELWDPSFIRSWKKEYAIRVFCHNKEKKETRALWRRKDVDPFDWPWEEMPNYKPGSANAKENKQTKKTPPKNPPEKKVSKKQSQTPEDYRNRIREFLKPHLKSGFIDQNYYNTIDGLISKIYDIEQLKKQITNVNTTVVDRARAHTVSLLTNYRDEGYIQDNPYKGYCVRLEEAKKMDSVRDILYEIQKEVNAVKAKEGK